MSALSQITPDPYNKVFNTIYPTNWRTIGIFVELNKIEVTLFNFRKFVIHMSFDEFLKFNERDVVLKKEYRFIHSVISCRVCHGAGCIDWIQKVRMKNEPVMHNVVKYYRDTNVINKFEHPIPYNYNRHKLKTIYGSVPKLNEGFEVCNECKGTGLKFTDGCGEVTNILCHERNYKSNGG